MSRPYYFKCWANGQALLDEVAKVSLSELPEAPVYEHLSPALFKPDEPQTTFIVREGDATTADGVAVRVWTELLRPDGTPSNKHHWLVIAK